MVADRTRTVILAARKAERLQDEASDLKNRGATRVDLVEFDAVNTASHAELIDEAFAGDEDIDVALLAFGVLGDQALAERDAEAALDVVQTNFVGAVSVLVSVAKRMREQGHGAIVVLSSVAGERGRKSNFVYGSSKAGLDVFCQGLADSLDGSGVQLLVVRPGFVRTKMTKDLKPVPFSTTAPKVAAAIVSGLRSKTHTVWVPAELRWVMSALRHTPRAIFRKLPI
jgi:decaprenylphospho-beta-D-erythro-pentofuranosid-2-ulose 2-reductase